jgi:hypothetical protein
MFPFDSREVQTTVPTFGRATRRRFDLGRLRPADLFDAWMFAEADATLALGVWCSAPRAEKRNAHAAYVAALERETKAADVLRRRVGDTRGR